MTAARRLVVPTNWDASLLGRLDPVAPAYLYGSLPDEPTLRSPLVLPAATEDDVRAHVGEAHRAGIAFTYVMNASCLGNRELGEEGRGEILQRFEWLRLVGARGLVTANPYVMQLARRFAPALELHVSVLAFVNEPRKAHFFEDLGASVIHLDPATNRDFRRLEAIRRAVRCRLSVVVNEGCLLSCPLRAYHANALSHAAESVRAGQWVDWCYVHCARRRAGDPAEWLRMPWVRPEDLGAYDAVGIDLYKIAGREKMGDGPSSHTDWIARVAGAYHARRSDDVASLLVGTNPPGPLRGAAPAAPRARIDARALDGFLDRFRAGGCDLDCDRCRHCEEWAARAVRVEGDAQAYARALDADLDALGAGSYPTGIG